VVSGELMDDQTENLTEDDDGRERLAQSMFANRSPAMQRQALAARDGLAKWFSERCLSK
jgi:hypothetical protein